MRSFFAFLERHGAATVLASELERVVEDPNVRAVLRHEKIVRDAPRAKGWACGGDTCERAVVERRSGKLVAVCTRQPPECEIVDVTANDLAQVSISLDALLDVARRITRADVPERRTTVDGVVFVGPRRGGPEAEEVWLALAPWKPAFRAWLSKRDGASVATRVLVPTRTVMNEEDFARPDEHRRVAVESMADVWTIRDGRFAAARALRAVANGEVPTTPQGRGLRVPRAKRWRDVDIHVVDPDTILVRAGGQAQRFTYADVGMAWTRNRRKKKAWLLLVAMCEGRGMFKWKAFGTFPNASKIVSELRAALQRLFGIEDDPFEPFSYADQWRTKFRAWPTADTDG